MSADRTFVDTNVLLYAYDVDAGDKHEIARRRLAELWETATGALSTQVLQEFYVTVTQKLAKPLTRRAAREVIETYDSWAPYRPTTADLLAASDLEERHKLSLADASIFVAAERCGCSTLLSEDLPEGQRLGAVSVVNPFDS